MIQCLNSRYQKLRRCKCYQDVEEQAKHCSLSSRITNTVILSFLHSVAESIPSSLVQIYAFLLFSSQRSPASILSIIVSIASIAFGSTTLCFDFDLDPERRIHNPGFYGYVPSNSGRRALVFYSMFLFSACHIALRLLGVALLAVFSSWITAAVLGGDVLLFLLLKLVRKDLRYWLKLDGALSWIMSIVIRLFTKVMVDFTVMVQLRRKCCRRKLSSSP